MNQKVLLDKSLEFSNDLRVTERKVRIERDNFQNLYESSISRVKELGNILNHVKKRDSFDSVQVAGKETVQYRSISVQVNQTSKEILSPTISHLQKENAILTQRNSHLIGINEELERIMQYTCLKQFNHESCQTNFVFNNFFQISDTARVVLTDNGIKDEWEIKRHVGTQIPTILQSDSYHDLLLKKKPRFNLETRNVESCIDDLQDFQVRNDKETSERISAIHAGPSPGENMIDALVYTMIGSWVRFYSLKKVPKI